MISKHIPDNCESPPGQLSNPVVQPVVTAIAAEHEHKPCFRIVIQINQNPVAQSLMPIEGLSIYQSHFMVNT